MSKYTTEAEQLHALNRIWVTYGKQIKWSIGILILIFSLIYWINYSNNERKDRAVVLYVSLSEDFINDRKESFSVKATKFIEEFTSNNNQESLVGLVYLMLAKYHVDKGDFEAAKNNYKSILSINYEDKNIDIKLIAKLRYAQMLINEKEYDSAISVIDDVKEEGMLGLVNEIKGDAYFSMGKIDLAIERYKASKDLYNKQGIESPIIDAKASQLLGK